MEKSEYFYRTAVYTERNGQIALADINAPERTTPLEPWFGLVIQLADGQHTLDELMQLLTQRYQGNPPDNLEETVSSVIERLVEGKLLALSNQSVELPYYLSLPIEHLDIDKAKEHMNKDGLTPN